MIKHLKISNIGPASKMELEFGKRLNLLTGDNGLGKSFLLDIAWWAITRKWPGELNPNLTAGKVALPSNKKQEARIDFSVNEKYTGVYDSLTQNWNVQQIRRPNHGLVFYALADSSFAVWDSARNYWKPKTADNPHERPPAYVFNSKEVWDGLQREDGTWLCNGLIRDWASWQKEKGRAFDSLIAVLDVMSPAPNEKLVPGDLTRISLDDVRDMPTLKMPYGQEVAVVHASSGMRRIISLAYFFVWCWEEHLKAKELIGGEPETKTLFLIDEVESHLHPKWQRSVIPALMKVMTQLMDSPEVQLIAVTHSPLVMASVEPLFDAQQDAWFDLDFERNKVVLRRRDFEKHGDVASWLISEAFDLKSGRPIEYERLVEEASALLDKEQPTANQIGEMHEKLVRALGPKDEFLFRWRAVCDKKGWFK